MSPIRSHAVRWLAASVCLALLVWPLAGPSWALVCLLCATLILLLQHLVQIDRLFDWARSAEEAPAPPGSGAWGHVFSALHRRNRIAAQDRQHLLHQLERQRDAMQAMPDGVIILHGANLIESVNVVAEQQFGIDHKRDVGLPLGNLVRQPEFVAMLESTATAASVLMPAPGLSGHMLSIQSIAFGDERKLLLASDVTHVERLETMRRDFVANVSHEMRTPLTVIHGYLEMLADEPGGVTSDEAQRFIAATLEQTRRIQHLVADLLALSSLETGSPLPGDEPVDVATLLEAVQREALTVSAGRHRIDLEPGPPAAIRGAEQELHSAIGNLAGNAVRYTQTGGRIRIGWRIVDGQGVIDVEDNGIGIEARHIPRLTERFYRVDRGRSRESGGTGLGLAIVKHVLERHQARLEIVSTPGRGSRFSVRLPAQRVVAREAANAA